MSLRINNGNKLIVYNNSQVAGDNNLWNQNGNNIYNTNTGNVGIGTQNPSYTLDISGNVKLTNIIDISNYDGSENQVLCSTPSGILWKYISNINERFPVSNTRFVDCSYGNDVIATLNPSYYPFSTITAALTGAPAGSLVIVNAGTYNETLNIPDNVSVAGTGA